jgi:FMN reductase
MRISLVRTHGGMDRDRPHIVALGGTLRPSSSTELALKTALKAVEATGATTHLIAGQDLVLPPYDPASRERLPTAARLIDNLRNCDGIIIGSPGYHGSISGMVKNALDYVEDMRDDPRPYFEGRPVGCIAVAAGDQACTATLIALRSIVHSLRGWPTPLGVTICSAEPPFNAEGECRSPVLRQRLEAMGAQIAMFTGGALAFNRVLPAFGDESGAGDTAAYVAAPANTN